METEHGSISEEPPVELTQIERDKVKETAVGLPAVMSSLKHVHHHTNPVKGTKALMKMNQKHGFDCPSCAWPDPEDHRSRFEFCENGAKAVATEITDKRVTPAFFKQYSVAALSEQSDYWLNEAGRITEPMVLKKGATHYEPISWDAAFELIADELKALPTPDAAAFYTSGRASNEAAYLYQLFVRMYGTNNLPDCSNMCHESSGSALRETIGIGKGTVTLDDIEHAECIFILGQNPGTNHPRMLTSLQKSVRNGCKIISVNPLPETGLKAFAHPQEIAGIMGKSTPLSSLFLQIRINGDLAFLKGVIKCLLAAEQANAGTVLDKTFIEQHTAGWDDFVADVESVTWDEILEATGLTRVEIESASKILQESKTTIFCWAMGLTQHKNSVPTIREVVNLALMQGNVGKPRAGLCPVRGHSNVQGDRTMGIWEKAPESFLKSLEKQFDFKAPRHHGLDTVEAIEAMHAGRVQFFFGLGGNFLSASPDTGYTAEALSRCRLTVQVSTKLNRGHLITGEQALILPCLGRSELDKQARGEQFVTVENSMGVVHQSKGNLVPASESLLSEPAIVCRMAQATLGQNTAVNWAGLLDDYDAIRNLIEATIPGFENFNERVRQPGGFYLPNAVKERVFNTPSGKAIFTANTMSHIGCEPGQFVLMTLRSHDQFNTTIYGLDDRYRGIQNERRIIFLNAEDMKELGFEAEQPLDITSHFEGESRVAEKFLAIPFSIPRRCAAAYYPETNVLVPINSKADISNTPTSKSIVITLNPSA